MGKPPVIGVSSRFGNADWIEENTRHYINVLNQYGIAPLILAPDTPVTLADGTRFEPDDAGRLPAALLEQLDGLILAGGGDVDPRYFGAQLAGANPDAIDHRRDELELNLAWRALELDLPLFGICRGCQVLNVAAGGGMVQHFAGHRAPTADPFFHDVVVAAESRFRAIVECDSLSVNTYHHQGLDLATLAPSLRAVGTAQPDTWLVEAVESPGHRWVIGVQWHPERLFELEPSHAKLWDSFVVACDRR